MKKWFEKWVAGRSRVKISGSGVIRCLNLLMKQGAELKDMRRSSEGVEAWMSTGKIGVLEHCAQKSGCTIQVLESRGLLAWKQHYGNRVGFIMGIVLALSLMLFFNCYIWQIDIKGNVSISDTQVLSRLNEFDLQQGCWKSGKALEQAKNQLLLKYPEWSWLSLSIEGSTLMVRLEEATIPPEIFEEGEPMDLVADRDGIIHSIVVRKGTPKVRSGDVVKAGDVLISGTIVIEKEDGSKEYEYTQAQGEVCAECIYTIEQIQEKHYIEKNYTGETVHELAVKGEEGEMILYRPFCSLEYTDQIEEVLGQGFTDFLAELPFISRTSLIRRTYVFYVPEEKEYREDQLQVMLRGELQTVRDELAERVQGVLLEDKTEFQNLGQQMKGIMTIHMVESMGELAPLVPVPEEIMD